MALLTRTLGLVSILVAPALALPSFAAPGLAGGPAPSTASAASAPDKRINEIWAKVKEDADRTPRALIEELGEMKSAAAFLKLKLCAGEMEGQWGKQRVFSAMRHFLKDDELAPRALAFVSKAARSRDVVESRAAVASLVNFGEPAKEVLFDVLEKSDDEKVRAMAIRPLRSDLAALRDAKTRDLLLSSFRVPDSGTQVQGLQLLRQFQEKDDFDTLAKYVGSKKSSPSMKQLIVIAMGGHRADGENTVSLGSEKVLLSALKRPDPVMQYHALSSLSRRGGLVEDSGMRVIDKLADSKNEIVRRAAVLVALVHKARGFDPIELAYDKDPIARQAAAITLGREVNDEAVDALHDLLSDDDTVVRIEAIRAAAHQRVKRSIPVLIGRLETETGRMRTDIRTSLQSLTARDYGLNLHSWRAFWKAEGKDFVVPTAKAAERARDKTAKRKSSGNTEVAFFGIDVVSENFALVIDTSGSMTAKSGEETRIVVARQQLELTLKRVRDGVLFNVIPFSGMARPMEDGLVPMGEEQRDEALLFAAAIETGGGTNIYDALSAAFEDDRVDTIYLMSDGDPSAGEIRDAVALRDEVARWNSVRRIVIHCIAVGQDHALLRGLSEDSGGKYVRVN